MSSVILVIHLFFALAIIGLVLLQRSEGGGLGIGGSGGGLGGFATPQGTANILTRATAICATGFFITSLTLGAIAGHHRASTGILDTLDAPAATSAAPKVTSSSPEAPAVRPNAPVSPQTKPDAGARAAQPTPTHPSPVPQKQPTAPISE